MDDSTAQVIGYWSVGDGESYKVSLRKIKLRESDTVSNILMTYNVDITVIDSTEDSYLLQWVYSNYHTSVENELLEKISSLMEGQKVILETDEFGRIKNVKNWKEIAANQKKAIEEIKKEFKYIASANRLFEQIEKTFISKSGIETSAIQDARQFYTFHGGKYTLRDTILSILQTPNIYNPKKPLDTKVILHLDELNKDEGTFIISLSQEVDSDQLTKATYEYLKEISKAMKTQRVKKKDIPKLKNMTTIVSKIRENGWLIYSKQKKIVSTPVATNIEERIIEIR